MIFIFPLVNSLNPKNYSTNVFSSFVISSMLSNSLIFIYFSFRYGIPFRGGDWWEWFFGDKDLGFSVRNGIIGCFILSIVFFVLLFLTIGIKTLVGNFVEINLSPIKDFLITIIPAYALVNLFFIYYFMKKRELVFFKWMWNPYRLEFNRFSSFLSLSLFFLVSILVCYRIFIM